MILLLSKLMKFTTRTIAMLRKIIEIVAGKVSSVSAITTMKINILIIIIIILDMKTASRQQVFPSKETFSLFECSFRKQNNNNINIVNNTIKWKM